MKLYCAKCGKFCAEFEGHIRKDTFIYVLCSVCRKGPKQKIDTPDFIKDIFGGFD